MANQTTKTNLNRLFAALRKEGVIARQNFRCCQSCAGYEIAEEAKKRNDSVGYVFYHKQDGADLRWEDTGNDYVLQHGCYLAFGVVDGEDSEAEQLGRRVQQLAAEHNVAISWNGSASTRLFLVGAQDVVKPNNGFNLR